MAQTVYPRYEGDLTSENYLDINSRTLRTGVLRDSQCTAGSTGWKVTVKAGEVLVDGAYIYDDLDKIDGLDLAHVSGNNGHYVVYQSYAHAPTNPPNASTFAVTSMAIPPAQPTIPAGAAKLADIFVPSTALTIGTIAPVDSTNPVQLSSTGVRIVQAPRLASRLDTGELLENLILSGSNVKLWSEGSISFDDALSKLYLPQTVYVQAICTTYRQTFQNAPALVRGVIPAAPAGLTVPGTIGNRDVLVYVLMDRSVPNINLPASIKMIDRLAPTSPELLELFDYNNRSKIVVLGVIFGDRLYLSDSPGQIPTPTSEPPAQFLRMHPLGTHYWAPITEDIIVSILSISSFSIVSANPREIGDILSSGDIDFSAAYAQGPPTVTSVINDQNAHPDDPLAQDPGVGQTFSYLGASMSDGDATQNGAALFTLSAHAGNTPDTAQVTQNWYRRVYWGFSATDPLAGNYNNAFLKTTIGGGGSPTTRSSLRAGRAFSFSMSAPGTPSYVFFAYPARHGAVTSIIDNNNGFQSIGAFTQVDAAQAGITTENGAAIAEDYRIYRTNNLISGAVNFTVS